MRKSGVNFFISIPVYSRHTGCERQGDPAAVLALVENPYITGQILNVDGEVSSQKS